MNKLFKPIFISLIIILVLNIIIPSVYALTSKYNFTSNENSNIQREDSFLYRNDCFKRSSFLGCSHLEILSAQVAEASASWYGDNEDKYEVDYSQNAHNIIEMLKEMGFENVSTNKYYTLEKEENSASVAVGYRNIRVDGKDYTLLAIIPRSAGYKQEWVGNFTVGDGDIHEGFKAARDEVLRYVNKYIKDNNIQGNLKVWIAGHSRGAAISNMLGGFFAGGGIEYFGGRVSITPEDVYCYTYATPRTIKNGADKNIELSVSENRENSDYINDTPGDAFNYTKGGQVDTEDEVYGGIKNFISPNDIFPMLPPESWGFTYYGSEISSDHGKVTEEAILKELKEISNYAYNRYINGGNPSTFERKTFDLKTLSIIKDNGNYSSMDMNTFLKSRMNGLTYNCSTNKLYKDEEYQEALTSVAGTYGMSMTLFENGFFEDRSSIVSSLLFAYLSYASERLQIEGRATNEAEAVTIALEELLSYFTKEEINSETFTVNDFVVMLAKFISDNENEPIADTVVSGIINFVPEDYQSFLSIFKAFDKNNTDENEVTIEEGLKAFLKACYHGPDPESSAAEYYADAAEVRGVLYGMLYMALGSSNPEIIPLLIGEDSQINAPGQFKDLVQVILDMIKTVKDDEGNVVKTYESLSELADDKLKDTIDSMFNDKLIKAETLYGNAYKNKLSGHIENVKTNISKVRELVLYALLYEDEPYSAESDIKNLTTFIGNMSIIPLAHYNEIYLAYAKAAKNFDCGYDEHDIEYNCIEGKDQNVNIKKGDLLSFEFDIDYDTFLREGKVIIDNNEISRDNYTISRGSTIITFNDEFTKTLSAGTHIIEASTDEGSSKVEFTISENGTTDDEIEIVKTSNPKTGDNIMKWVSLMIISLLGMVVTKKILKNNK